MRGKTIMAVLVAGALLAAPAAAPAEKLRVRKDAASLTAKERSQLVEALHALKAADYPYDADPDGIRWYDQFVQWHVELSLCDGAPNDTSGIFGHGGPMFLPWHRQYVLELEDALRAVSGRHISLPYWNWTSPASTNAVFDDRLMGGNGNQERSGRLERGPFSYDKWPLHVDNSALALYSATSTRWITRAIGSEYVRDLPSQADADFALGRPVFDVAPWADNSDARRSFRMALEGVHENHDPATDGQFPGVQGCGRDLVGKGGITPASMVFGRGTLHNSVHGYVGGMTPPDEEGATLLGTMTVPLASPNDPVFFLHHANVDRLWAQWQKAHPDDPYRPRGAAAGESFPDNEIDSPLTPWTHASPRTVADIEALGYTYAEPAPSGAAARARARRRSGARASLLCRLRRL